MSDPKPPKAAWYTIENGRRYKAGFAPSELMHPVKATCGQCGQHTLLIFPAGAVCSNCSPAGLKEIFTRDLDRRRMLMGAVPESEL